MQYDYSELRGRIYAKYRNQSRFAKALGVSTGTLSLRLDSTKQFTIDEVEKCIKLLEIPRDKIYDYFFIHKEV